MTWISKCTLKKRDFYPYQLLHSKLFHYLLMMYFLWGHSIITFAPREEGVPSKCELMQTRRGERVHVNANIRVKVFLFKHLAHKLFALITRFFVCFIKTPVLLKIAVLKNIFRSIFHLFVWFMIKPDCWRESCFHGNRYLDIL